MQNQLNYYSRYNRIKVEDKKQIPSLYSLLSFQTLTKLAHDASVSLQMISHYKKQKLYHSVDGDHETQQSEYLQANNLFTFRSFQSESVDRKISRHTNNKRNQSLITKKKLKLNQKSEQQKLSKQVYLQNLVGEIRSKSIQRLHGSALSKDQIKRQKKSKKKNSLKFNQNPRQQNFQNKGNQNMLGDNNSGKNKNLPDQIEQKIIHKKIIKSLVSQQENSVKQVTNKNKMVCQLEQKNQLRKQYVESIDDGNEKELSSPSIVLERLNFKVGDTQPSKLQGQIKKIILNQRFQTESKEDNPSSNDGKQSEIKSFSKKIEQLKKPFKNLIELQLTHSQSQIWQPEERSLEIPHRQFQQSREDFIILKDQQEANELNFVNHNLDQRNSRQGGRMGKQKVQVLSGIENLDEIKDNVHFLSQINHQKPILQPPYEHPLQTQNYSIPVQHQQTHFNVPVKKSFKKFILNKELNARLVTSTILNEINQRNIHLQKQKIKNQINENQNQKSQISVPKIKQKSQKINFKALIKKKKEAEKQDNLPLKTEKALPLRKLENQKLLQAFFNNN